MKDGGVTNVCKHINNKVGFSKHMTELNVLKRESSKKMIYFNIV